MLLTNTIWNETYKIIRTDIDRTLLSLEPKDWETNFFNRKFGLLNIGLEALGLTESKTVNESLDELLAFAEKQEYALIELVVNSEGMPILPILEEKGFRLVDTKMVFITLMNKSQIKAYPPQSGELCLATKEMKSDILQLTHKCFTHNPDFFSRFKNKFYFTPEETENYYSAWIDNYLENADALFAVSKENDKIIAYSIFGHSGLYKGKPIYKGILVAVDPEYRGKNLHMALHSFVYDKLPVDDFYVNTTTQLSNLATIKNYIKSKKHLDHIEFIFYKSLIGPAVEEKRKINL